MRKRDIRKQKIRKTTSSQSRFKKKSVFGTKQFADVTYNIQRGCEYGCHYCYACAIVFGRFHKIKNWTQPVIDEKAVMKGWKNIPKRIMFPSSHDITPFNIDECLVSLKKMLEGGRDVLIVTKPNFKCVKALCKELAPYKDQVVLRFTITSCDNKILRKWEPRSPLYEVRLKCLQYAFEQGFQTSVLIEPLLDLTPYQIIDDVDRYVTDKSWIGRMNDGRARLTFNGVTDQSLFDLHDALIDSQNNFWDEFRVALKDNPKIRWKGIDDAEV